MLALSVCWAGATCHAQEIEPRAYAPSPVGVNLLLGIAGYSEGGVLTDPSLPVTDIEAKISALGWGYGRTFSLAGRSANVGFAVPYLQVDASGNIGEERASVSREGVGDTKLRLAVNLIGGPAMTPREFAQREPTTTLGLGLMVNVPTGEYDPTKLVNIGTNRWAAKTELGLSHPMGKWLLEAYAGAWWFDENDNFFGGQLREQDPLTSFQAHLSYNFNPRLWVALNTTYYEGGRTTVNGVDKHDRQANSRVGVTFSMPVGKKYSLKFSVSRGATTRIGSNFTNFGLGLTYAWMEKPRP
ncbi:MAG TPA: transporter [Steroidobacteraceae bacterium]|nr:transporter [Steroidobacteraceae bacterium]